MSSPPSPSSDHLGTILESVKDYAIFTLDENGVVTSWNAGAQRIFGFSPEEIVGASSTILWTSEDQAQGTYLQEISTAVRDELAKGKRWHLRRDGSRFLASGILRPMYDSAGTLLGLQKCVTTLRRW